MGLSQKERNQLLVEQQNELDSHHIYLRLSQLMDNKVNQDILKNISEDEYRHYTFLKTLTGEDSKPNKHKVSRFVLIARLLGLTFAVKLLEHGVTPRWLMVVWLTPCPALLGS
jgi:hypothetical protein